MRWPGLWQDQGVPQELLAAPEAPLLSGCSLILDHSAREISSGLWAGGTPLRLLRLSETAEELLKSLLGGTPSGGTGAALARRLVDSGMAHPQFEDSPFGLEDLTVVIPIRDRSGELDALLWRLAPLRCLVVDDASDEPLLLAQVCAEHGARLLRSDDPLGPGGARNLGAAQVTSPLVAFVDSDVSCSAEDLESLLGQFSDPRVAGVAPRVRGPHGARLLERFESDASPLDMGTRRSIVRPGTKVSYVPTACLILRQELSIDLFDASLSVGEDVDAIWRIAQAGWSLRFEPGTEVEHPSRPTLRSWMTQRHSYGRSAGALGRRHGEAIAPLRGTPWVLLGWGAAAVGYPGLGLGLVVGSAPRLAKKLEGVSESPERLALELTLRQGFEALPVVARQLLRSYAPVLLLAAVFSGRARRSLFGIVLLAGFGRWRGHHARLDPLRFAALSCLDDLVYCSGLWRGALEERSLRSLRPAVILSD